MTQDRSTAPIGSNPQAHTPNRRIGIDIGGTKTEAVLLADRNLTKQVRFPTGFGTNAVVAAAINAVELLGDADSIGIGIAGIVDPSTGYVDHAVNLGVNQLDLVGTLRERIGIPVHVENDVNAAALGAFQLDPEASGSMAYLNLGTGLAAGIVLDGKLWQGSGGIAGEVGHIPTNSTGPRCPCGQRGCLELKASGSALTKAWQEEHHKTGFAAALAAGDATASRVLHTFAVGVAQAVRMLALTIGLDRIILGGGASRLGEPLLDATQAVLARWENQSPFLKSQRLRDRISLAPDGPLAAIGAAFLPSGSRPDRS